MKKDAITKVINSSKSAPTPRARRRPVILCTNYVRIIVDQCSLVIEFAELASCTGRLDGLACYRIDAWRSIITLWKRWLWLEWVRRKLNAFFYSSMFFTDFGCWGESEFIDILQFEACASEHGPAVTPRRAWAVIYEVCDWFCMIKSFMLQSDSWNSQCKLRPVLP